MTYLKYLPALAASAMLMVASGAFAADYATPAAKTPPASTTAPASTEATPNTKTTKAKSPEGIECSKEADAKGLHGDERKKFRHDCKTALKAHKPMPDTANKG